MKVQRTAKRYGDSGNGKQAGLRLLLLAVAIMAAKTPPQTNTRQTTKRLQCRYGAKILVALRRVKPNGYRVP